MMSLLMTSEIRFEVLRRAGKTLMGIFLDYICCAHIVQSICNISEIANKKTQPQFKIFIEGGYRFWVRILLTLKCHIAFNF